MTERTAAVRWGIIAAGLVIAVVAIALLVYGLVQHGDEPTPGNASDQTSQSPEPTDEPDDADGSGAADGDQTDTGSDDDGSADDGGSGDAGNADGTKDVLPRDDYVPEPLNGQEAIDALGDDIEEVADRNGKTVEEFEEFLLKNPSAFVQPDGFVVFKETATPDAG